MWLNCTMIELTACTCNRNIRKMNQNMPKFFYNQTILMSETSVMFCSFWKPTLCDVGLTAELWVICKAPPGSCVTSEFPSVTVIYNVTDWFSLFIQQQITHKSSPGSLHLQLNVFYLHLHCGKQKTTIIKHLGTVSIKGLLDRTLEIVVETAFCIMQNKQISSNRVQQD